MNYADQVPPRIVGLPFSLIAVSVAAGILMMVLFKVTSRPEAIRQAKRQVQAQLLALRLFGDEPSFVWRAQVRLLTGNVRYIGVMLVPILAAAIPFALAFPHLEAIYGRSPLRVGTATILTLRLSRPLGEPLPEPRLELPAGLRADAPPVRVPDSGEISWRLLAENPVNGPVRIQVNDMAVTKAVQVGSAHGYLNETRPASAMAWLMDPGEAPIGTSGIQSVSVVYGAQRLSGLGLEWPWEAWFVVISFLAALLVKNRLGVVF